MRLKAGVVLCVGAPLARRLTDIEECVLKVTGLELFITSAADGVHMPGSRHYTGEAIDLRIRSVDADKRVVLRAALQSVLGSLFDVVLEVDHIHIEFDPR